MALGAIFFFFLDLELCYVLLVQYHFMVTNTQPSTMRYKQNLQQTFILYFNDIKWRPTIFDQWRKISFHRIFYFYLIFMVAPNVKPLTLIAIFNGSVVKNISRLQAIGAQYKTHWAIISKLSWSVLICFHLACSGIKWCPMLAIEIILWLLSHCWNK